ncbi:MAG: metallophosphoesterase [Elusimicrobia bacterium]|nr:metallophosphoesterase [Elusimicrobiota bacterium]
MLQILGFLGLVVLVYLGMQYYAAFWLIRSFPGLPVAASTVRIAVLLLALLFPLSVWSLRHGGPLAQGLALGMYVWTGILLIWVFWALCGDLALLAARMLAPTAPARPWLGWGVLAAVALSSAYAVWNAARLPAVVTVEVVLPRLPASLDGFTIVQISDLHVGLTVPLKRLEGIAAMVDKLHPDLIALTGDLVDQARPPRKPSPRPAPAFTPGTAKWRCSATTSSTTAWKTPRPASRAAEPGSCATRSWTWQGSRSRGSTTSWPPA